MTGERVAMITQCLQSALVPDSLDVIDESRLHEGHAGAESGKGHFAITIVSDRFAGLAPVQRHRLVYDALKEAMHTDIHALSIHAYAPDEL